MMAYGAVQAYAAKHGALQTALLRALKPVTVFRQRKLPHIPMSFST